MTERDKKIKPESKKAELNVMQAWEELGGQTGLEITSFQIKNVLNAHYNLAVSLDNRDKVMRFYTALQFETNPEGIFQAVGWFQEQARETSKLIDSDLTSGSLFSCTSRSVKRTEINRIGRLVKRYLSADAALGFLMDFHSRAGREV